MTDPIPMSPQCTRPLRGCGPRLPSRSRGAALVVSLLLLITLTLIGVTGMRNASMEERMAGNLRDRNVAFQASEGAVRDGEQWIVGRTAIPDTGTSGTADVYAETVSLTGLGSQTPAWWASAANTKAGTTLVDEDTGEAFVAEQPRYLLQYIEFIPDSFDVGIAEPTGRHFYRVTGHGTGFTTTARVVIQTTFVKRFN